MTTEYVLYCLSCGDRSDWFSDDAGEEWAHEQLDGCQGGERIKVEDGENVLLTGRTSIGDFNVGDEVRGDTSLGEPDYFVIDRFEILGAQGIVAVNDDEAGDTSAYLDHLEHA
ncbi:MAG TPA: hypothetical protein VFX15_03110 [Actinomycetes bacterium]|nr:hypothetical protein [Actinomycetes bacterium]